jgi:hypothetical protein
MYNNAQIEKKYGYYDNVRRTTSSFIDAIINSSVSKKALENLKQDLILNNPNYWLSNALAALASWMLDDKENTEKELNNALKKDSKKTSLFFCLINLKLGRTTTSINWLNKYLSEQNPTKLDKDFITVLDLISTGAFGDEAKEKSFIKIQTWFERLNGEKSIQDAQNTIWHDFLKSNQETDITMPKLEQYSKDTQKLKNNLAITSTYYNILNHLESIINTTQSNKQLDEIISDLIYEYETKEQIYQKDNLRNHLIIECNGNREEAERLYKKQESIYNDETDLLTLLSNIIIFKDSYKISNETQKISLSLMKNHILKSITELNKNIDNEEINIQIDNFYTKTIDGKNINETKKDLDNYLNTLFSEDDKDILLILIIINILGIIGIFITLKNQLLSTILIIILVISNIVFLFKLNQRTKYRTLAKTKEKAAKEAIIERILAEVIDYKNMMIEDQQHFSQLSTYLNNLNAKNYSKSNNERNINIGV